MTANDTLQEKAINTIRFLSADAVQQANSGHPGLPMGMAAAAYTIWTRHLRHNPANPAWFNRDRFVLSGGHGSMLLYSLLHLTGYAVSLDEIRNFRQWGSITPGHPESFMTPGVEVTTGPLGQGFANGVGMAVAEAHLAARFNREGHTLVDHHIYGIVTDGDLMEGISAEAASFAGHQQLGKLVYMFDNNHISIDGGTELAFTEERGKRFEAYGWHVQHVRDGNDVAAIDAAVSMAKSDPRPSLIVTDSIIGFGMPNKQGTKHAHGEPPGDDELNAAKDNLGWPQEPRFLVPDDVRAFFQEAVARGQQLEDGWNEVLNAYQQAFPDEGKEMARILAGTLPAGWDADIPTFETDAKGMATRAASGTVLNAIAKNLPDLIGGSADLEPSNKTWIKGDEDFQAGNRAGRNFHFGVREHGMGGIVNGMSLYPGVIPYGGTFLVFSDYMRGALRLSALSHYPAIWVFTHDSIGVGEDGPTHQPIEQLMSLRLIPHMVVLRPGDANEVAAAWRVAIERRDGPTGLIFSRQNMPTLDRSVYTDAAETAKGAYVLADLGDGEPELILMASGSEVQWIVQAGERLAAEGRNVRLVSFPSWELFEQQDASYRESVLPKQVKARLAVEAGTSIGWARYVGDHGDTICIDHFGASAPGERVMDEFGFTAENVIAQAMALLS